MGIMDRIKKTKDETAVDEKSVKPAKKTVKKAAAPKATKAESPKKEEVEKVAKSETAPLVTKATNRVLIRPVVTEKASSAQQGANKYTFIVATWAKKNAIKSEVKAVYGVEPVAVNVINVQGHRVRFGRNLGKRSDFKKAIVTLPPGKTITIHEGV